MDLKRNNGEIELKFTDDEIASLERVSDQPDTFPNLVDGFCEDMAAIRPWYPVNLGYEVLHAAWRSEELAMCGLSQDQLHELGARAGLALVQKSA